MNENQHSDTDGNGLRLKGETFQCDDCSGDFNAMVAMTTT